MRWKASAQFKHTIENSSVSVIPELPLHWTASNIKMKTNQIKSIKLGIYLSQQFNSASNLQLKVNFLFHSLHPLQLTAKCQQKCTFHLGDLLQLFSATNTFSLLRYGCTSLTSTPYSIFQPIIQFILIITSPRMTSTFWLQEQPY